MRDVLGLGTELGYCTNVHAGRDYEEILENLERHTLAVKQRVSPDDPMGVGLWFSAQAAEEIVYGDLVESFRDWLGERGLRAFTLNGFPYGDFHQKVVKHRVYEPDWSTNQRGDYTLTLTALLAGLLDDGAEGSISTLPLGWRGAPCPDWSLDAAIEKLLIVVDTLAKIKEQTGKTIHLDLEPEPGCYLDMGRDVIGLFEKMFDRHCAERVRDHLRVCYDVCHAAVMFEDQAGLVKAYHEAGIRIGKVQISSAVKANMGKDAVATREQLAQFQEDRYLHQTVVQNGGEKRFYTDLPEALKAEAGLGDGGQWRTHFHVPIYLERFGLLETTRDEIVPLLKEVLALHDCKHFEVETYA